MDGMGRGIGRQKETTSNRPEKNSRVGPVLGQRAMTPTNGISSQVEHQLFEGGTL